MAKITIFAGQNFVIRLRQLPVAMSGAIEKMAIYEGAKITMDEIKKEMASSFKTRTEGGLQDSIGIAPMQHGDDGWNAKIGFDGYDKEGVANAMKARVLESGSRKRKKHPFIRPAVNRVKEKAQDAMKKIIEDELKKAMKE